MLIRACFKCKFHEIKQGEEVRASYCKKESCWSEYSDCITLKALERFLKDETESQSDALTKGS